MCGRFTLGVDLEELIAAFPEFAPPTELEPRYNIAPTQPVAVVPNDGQQKISFFQWGLIPFWAKDPSIGSRMINARAETLSEKPSFRDAYQKRRCLVLADGFYEWREEPEKKGKTPFYVQLSTGEPFAFAGLWERWQSKAEESTILSCTLITTEPNDLLAPIHNRMPVILPRSAYTQWLDPAPKAARELQELLQPYPSSKMRAFAVSTLVNSPDNESPACILPAAS